jgi:hypothetical protein
LRPAFVWPLNAAGASGSCGHNCLDTTTGNRHEGLRLRRGGTGLIFGALRRSAPKQFNRESTAERVLGAASDRIAAALVERLGARAVIDARTDEAEDSFRKLAPNGVDTAWTNLP